MDKRTKILLIVLAALILVGGGIFGYMYMTVEKAEPVVVAAKPNVPKPAAPAPAQATPPAPAAPGKAPVTAQATPAAPTASGKAPVTAQATPPAPAASGKAPVTAQAKPPVPAVPGKAPAPAQAKPPVPVVPGKAPVTAQGKPPVPAAPGKAPATAQAKAPAPAAPGAPVITVIEKGRQVQYGSPEEFLAKTTMSPADIRGYANKALDEAKKTYDSLQKGKASKDALDRADKNLKMVERLTALVKAKYPAEEKAYVYSSLGKRDPFMSPFEVPKVLPKITSNMTPLEKTPTETLVLRAVLWSQKGYRALIETPDGRGFTVKVGDTVGNKGGKIVKISGKIVYVTEKIPDILGDIETRNILLKLHKEAE